MGRIVTLLVTLAVVVTSILVGCVKPTTPATPTTSTEPEPTVTPEYQALIDQGLVSSHLELNPFGEDFAVKPDGTPYHFACSIVAMSSEELVNYEGPMRSLITRAGGKYTFFDPGFNLEQQQNWVTDLITTVQPDAILIQSIDENGLARPADQAAAAGISVFPFGSDTYTDSVIATARTHPDGEAGANIVAEFFVQKAEAENNEIHIFEIWGPKSMAQLVERHTGFHRVVDGHPLITVLESTESFCTEEVTTDYTLDAFTAHPELNGIFHQCGGCTGVVPALAALDRLLPIDDPDHVLVATFEGNSILMDEMVKGNIDACASFGGWHQVDACVKLAFTSIVLGQPVPKVVDIPLFLLTGDTIKTEQMFGAVYWAAMPMNQWDLWPVLDTTSLGLETPTKAMRMQLKGY